MSINLNVGLQIGRGIGRWMKGSCSFYGAKGLKNSFGGHVSSAEVKARSQPCRCYGVEKREAHKKMHKSYGGEGWLEIHTLQN